MSCPDEFTWSIYIDDELPREEVRTVEMHLVSCRDCRNQVVALRDEIAALSGALREDESTHTISRPSPVPARELSWGLPVAVAAVTAVLSIGGILIELRLPGVLDLLNPTRLIGVNDMIFDAVFLLRDRWPELFEATASVGAMAAFSALGCAVLHAVSRRVTRTSSLLLLLCFAVAAPDAAEALDIRHDQDTHILADETISEALACTGEVVTMSGTVDGDLFVGAERVTIRGTVTGNLFVFGREVEIDGVVKGSIIVIGDQVDLDGRVDGAVTLFGDRLTIMEGAQLGRDVALFGEGVRVAGRVPRDLTFAGEWLEVRGVIERDLHVLGADGVSLLESARIGRDVRARLWGRRDSIEQAPGASVGGEIELTRESIVREHYLAHYRHVEFYMTLAVMAAAAFLFGLLLYLLDPRLFEADLPNARGFIRSLGLGFVLVLVTPVALVLVGLTVVGLPIAVLGLFLLISSLYSSFVLVAGLMGQAVLKPSGSGIGSFAPSLLVGVLLLSVAAALPFVGAAVRILAVLFGLGCLFERVRGLQVLNLRGVRA